ncbi:zinc finger CCCH domain-containing 19 [Chlorella sorokiniana]|uniref:Zinc finger CCCH domain-containing 19 n=1 Tax=Chlorella sorokiniana TaxID=3076 RepID=A0A2P6U187_CHLSO|nr:zinc finger CCCH domain-containing 19 [Chlorella sorokiniana]|eukprot:PRW60071.1 zinc finger CCCH domain-containing 19 [Chlorella sorokiniana]
MNLEQVLQEVLTRQTVKVTKYPLLSLDPKSAMPLDIWLTGVETALTLQNVAPGAWVQTAILNGMDTTVQATCLALLQAGELPSWQALKDVLQLNYGKFNQQRQAENELEKLHCKGSTLGSVRNFVHLSRMLHLRAGTLLTTHAKYKYFMRGLPPALQQPLVTAITMQLALQARSPPEHPIQWETFEEASQLLLEMLGHRLNAEGDSADEAVPMELASVHKAGWGPPPKPPPGPPSRRSPPKPPNSGQGRRSQGGRGNGSGRGQPNGGRGWSSGGRSRPPPWKPSMPRKEREALMDKGLCLCCKCSTDHTWRDCPRNPNRGN